MRIKKTFALRKSSEKMFLKFMEDGEVTHGAKSSVISMSLSSSRVSPAQFRFQSNEKLKDSNRTPAEMQEESNIQSKARLK